MRARVLCSLWAARTLTSVVRVTRMGVRHFSSLCGVLRKGVRRSLVISERLRHVLLSVARRCPGLRNNGTRHATTPLPYRVLPPHNHGCVRPDLPIENLAHACPSASGNYIKKMDGGMRMRAGITSHSLQVPLFRHPIVHFLSNTFAHIQARGAGRLCKVSVGAHMGQPC